MLGGTKTMKKKSLMEVRSALKFIEDNFGYTVVNLMEDVSFDNLLIEYSSRNMDNIRIIRERGCYDFEVKLWGEYYSFGLLKKYLLQNQIIKGTYKGNDGFMALVKEVEMELKNIEQYGSRIKKEEMLEYFKINPAYKLEWQK
jgi:hypothetical protein